MHIVSFLVDPRAYRDRVLMWQRAAERVGTMTLLTAVPRPELAWPTSSALRIVPLGPGPLRRQPARLALMRWWEAQPRPPEILHDAQGFMLPLFARVGRGGPVRLTSTFASTWDWFTHLRGRHPVEWGVREARYWSHLALEWSLARVSDAFTVFGEGHRAPFARAYRVPLDRVFSIPNCVDPHGFSPDGPTTATGFAGDGPVLLFVGQLFRYKGVHELLEAVAALPGVRLLLVGTAPGQAEAVVRARIDALGVGGRVRVVGAVPHEALPGLLRAADVVVLPSYTEGSPRVLIEAMACGRPIVGTDIPGIATLDPQGTCIVRVPRADAGALTAALARVLADPSAAAAAGARAHQRYLAHHTPEAAGDALAALYRQLVP